MDSGDSGAGCGLIWWAISAQAKTGLAGPQTRVPRISHHVPPTRFFKRSSRVSSLPRNRSRQAQNDWKRWWQRPPCFAPTDQLPVPASSTAHDGADLALRAALDPYHWNHPCMQPWLPLCALVLTISLGVRRVHEPGCMSTFEHSEPCEPRLTTIYRRCD